MTRHAFEIADAQFSERMNTARTTHENATSGQAAGANSRPSAADFSQRYGTRDITVRPASREAFTTPQRRAEIEREREYLRRERDCLILSVVIGALTGCAIAIYHVVTGVPF